MTAFEKGHSLMRKLGGSIALEVNWGRAFLPPGKQEARGSLSGTGASIRRDVLGGDEAVQCEGRTAPAPNFIPLVPEYDELSLVFPSREFARWKVNNLALERKGLL